MGFGGGGGCFVSSAPTHTLRTQLDWIPTVSVHVHGTCSRSASCVVVFARSKDTHTVHMCQRLSPSLLRPQVWCGTTMIGSQAAHAVLRQHCNMLDLDTIPNKQECSCGEICCSLSQSPQTWVMQGQSIVQCRCQSSSCGGSSTSIRIFLSIAPLSTAAGVICKQHRFLGPLTEHCSCGLPVPYLQVCEPPCRLWPHLLGRASWGFRYRPLPAVATVPSGAERHARSLSRSLALK